MGSYRWREMSRYIQACPGAILRQGALKGERTGEIFSYAMLIGRVFHEKKIVMYREDAGKQSRTTNMHMGAIRMSHALQELGWTFLPVSANQMSAIDPADAARQLWGNKVREKDLGSILNYRKLLERGLYLSHIKKNFESIRDTMLREYVKVSRMKREAMQAILEMQIEQKEQV